MTAGDADVGDFIGVPGEPYTASERVNAAMIRHWCDAIGDRNPRYASGEIAPPSMLAIWTMRGLAPQPAGEALRSKLLRLLDEQGYTGVIATNQEQTYHRELRAGDLITATTTIGSVSDEKRTALGPGRFIEYSTTFTDERGEMLGVQTFRLLKYKPKPAPVKGKRPRPPVNQDTEFFWDGLREGELRIQRCASCGVLRHPPRAMCGACRSLEWDSIAASGRGEVYSFTVNHEPPIPGFTMPYVTVLVQLEEGTRLVANLRDADPADVTIGMPVQLAYERVDDALTMPYFTPNLR